MAAAFHAVNGFLVALSSGRRVADHVDTALIFWIELGVWCAIVHARRRDAWSLATDRARAGRGAAHKVTSRIAPRRRGLGGLHRTRAVRQSRASRRRCPGNRRRNLGAVDDLYASRVSARSGMVWRSTWSGISSTPLRVTMPPRRSTFATCRSTSASWSGFRSRHSRWPRSANVSCVAVAAWLLITYIAFSAARTRMSSFVMIAAPAVFLIEAGLLAPAARTEPSHARWRGVP